MPTRYHLRFQLHPTPAAERQTAELAAFCRESGVSEVVLLLAAEEFHDGHPTGADEDGLYATTAAATAVLRDAGLDVSLNPWVTTGHADRGRVDRLGFHPVVGADGRTARAQASLACPRWRGWLAAHYGRFARLAPRTLWLEDDFRLHNHAPLAWGGGFEPLMLDRLAALVGAPVTREDVLAAVTAPGRPHPWRALLRQTWRTAQSEVAELVARTVAEESSGRTRLGLMTSDPAAHAVEGRDWAALFDAVSIGGEAVHRPHFAPYEDAPGRSLGRSVWTLDHQRTLRPAGVRVEPEIENWPHTAWSTSDTQTWSELVTAQLSGVDALLLNLLPVPSGHAGRHPRVAGLLRRARPALDHVADRAHRDTDGVAVVTHPDAPAHVRTPRAGTPGDLAVDPGPCAGFLLGYGVPVTAGDAPVRALFGQGARALDDATLRRLLGGGLLLDGVAAAVLAERGFGELTGVAVEGVVERDAPAAPGPYSLERVLGGCPVAEDGVDLFLSVNMQPRLARLRPLPGAEAWTEVLTPDLRPWGAGRCVYDNALGGRIAVLAATDPAALPRDDDGQRLLHALVRRVEGEDSELPLVSGGPHLVPRLARNGGGRQLAVANGSADPARPRVTLPRGARLAEATLLAPLAPPAPATLTATDGVLTLDQELPHRGWLLLDLDTD
ncbi:hypothetical protein ABT160_45665 [Streptomyces sp. NPDC001941]|uniref:hypothetical protein n=1 Tax=Streptomyces sp. NPDC001941 TaxID=3154659 RepID=UPI003322CFB6